MIKEIKIAIPQPLKTYKIYNEEIELEPTQFKEQYLVIHEWKPDMFNSLEIFEEELYKLEDVKVVGIPFINSEWEMQTICPKCKEEIEFKGRVDNKNKIINTKIKFCKYCGYKINWNINHLI